MGKRMDITEETNDQEFEEDELEEEGEEGEEGEESEEEEKPRRKVKRFSEEAPATKKDLNQITQIIRSLQANATTKEEKTEASHIEKLLGSMLQNGAKEDQVAGLLAVANAIQKDLEVKYEEKSASTRQQTLDERCVDDIDRALDEYEKTYGEVISIGRLTFRSRVLERMRDQEKYAGAREQYQNKKKPAEAVFRKATAEVVETFLKKNGLMKRADPNKEQLDLGDSRSSPTKRTPAEKESGRGSNATNFDPKSITDPLERDVWTTAMNTTKSKDIAYDALMSIRKASRQQR